LPCVGFVGADGRSYSFDDALEMASSGDSPIFPYPYPLLAGMVEQMRDRGSYISVTSLLHCTRAEYLKRVEPYYISVEDAYPMFRGTLFHAMLEKSAHESAITEQKTLRIYKGVEIGGTYDSMVVLPVKHKMGCDYLRNGATSPCNCPAAESKRFVLQDWKTTKSLPKYDSPYSTHIQQINLYRWLNNLKPEEVIMEVWYFSMEGFKRCRLKDGTGPARGGRAPTNQHWSDQEIESFLDQRLMSLKASMMLDIPMPYDTVPEDWKWECAYCPVRDKCSRVMLTEREAVWRERYGLKPEDAGKMGEAAPLWDSLVGYYQTRADGASKKPPEVPKAEIPKVSDALYTLVNAVPKPEPRAKRGRPRKDATNG
jgi:hypothetical protein